MDIFGFEVEEDWIPSENAVTVYVDGELIGGGYRCLPSGYPNATGEQYSPRWSVASGPIDDPPVLDRRGFLEYFVSLSESEGFEGLGG